MHDPGKHGGAEDITHARYGRVIKQEKDVTVFESLRTPAGNDIRTVFRSKNFSVIHLHEAISALQWAGLEQKKLPKACMPEVKLSECVTLVELSELYTGSLVKLPIIKGSHVSAGRVEPIVLQRKEEKSSDGVRDYHWTTATVFYLLHNPSATLP